MALVQCRDCGKSVSTEAADCPHCGAPQQQHVPPPLPAEPPSLLQSTDETIYADNAVAVTTTRVIIWGTTYALRNITSVRMTFTPARVAGAIFLLIAGLMVALVALAIGSFVGADGIQYPLIGVYVFAGAIIAIAILLMTKAKPMYHVNLSSASGEIHALTSKNKTYIEKVVVSINDAIVKYK
jgi:Family of unknown function (DUF6232)